LESNTGGAKTARRRVPTKSRNSPSAGASSACTAAAKGLPALRSHRGQLDRAERALRTALDGLAAEEVRVLRGVVSLELAVVWRRQGHLAEATTLAAETAVSLLAIGVPREAQKALNVLLAALDAQAATAALVQEVVDFLRRVEHAPQAHFEMSGA
jgi:hypothetical protein